ncbi:hypothetical protein A3E39_01710 [Candidatus Uhrbacteria bacterium RIFCSPHIGHO2_12_FULL_60_25]|uniref:Uncharacterized protein n=1 Tax=Candidatus Uhrbacteria bacterium RIFCSPHIGHO2_12_FULL_60_25 TaxID=1802399 RepID=A0A1F7UK30_9BACT|nr:MAG: hypothetical protein A3D73_01880 [Candidatus Uhrbacteria bacterium RIFCSPHIGHO2_02_FULL_60_44]OGL78632.1 MAG: hypothetical protein A3E39_01710 [Candidatus Uhrbacteria bacterium RIFCSPHIGHO2_12_FULL_60_25]
MKTITKTKTQTQVSTRVAVTSIVAAAFGAGLIAYGFSIGYLKINPYPIMPNLITPAVSEVCNNGIDDDKDGFIDCRDIGSCSGTSMCPLCGALEVVSNVDKTYYRQWFFANSAYKEADVIRLTIRNKNTNPLCELRLVSAKFGLKKKRAGWNIKDIKFINESTGWTTLAGPGTCGITKNVCNYDWSLSNVSLKPGEEIYARVQADLTGGLQFNDGVYFYLRAPAGFTAKDRNDISYSWNTAIDGIEAFLNSTKPDEVLKLETVQ